MYGLSNKLLDEIKYIKNKTNKKLLIFGSRARGDYKMNSDIDIAVIGKIDESTEYSIRNKFDLLDIPYTVDLVFFDRGIKEELEKSIKKEGVEL